MFEPTFSVIVITRNRAKSLIGTMESLIHQNYDPGKYEVIVVDNGSVDNTALLIKKLVIQHPKRIQYVYESQIGMSAARNKGAAVAKGEILTFIDDDALASEGWLKCYSDFYQTYPEIVAAGGKIELKFECSVPPWLTNELLIPLGYYDISDREIMLDNEMYPFGGNFSVKKEIFYRIGGFLIEFKACNEEKAFFLKLSTNGYKIGYTPRAIVYHRIEKYRLKKWFFIRRGFRQGVANVKVWSMFNLDKIPKWQIRFKQILWDGVVFSRNLFFKRKKKMFVDLYHLCLAAGEMSGLILRRLFWDEHRPYCDKNGKS